MAIPAPKPFGYDPLGQLAQQQPAPEMGYQAYKPPVLTRQSLETKPLRTRFSEFYHYNRRIQEEQNDMDALEKMQADMEMERRRYERMQALTAQHRARLFQQAPAQPGMPQMNMAELGGAALGGLITGDFENAIGASYGAAQAREQQAYQGQMQEYQRQHGMAEFDYRTHLQNLEQQGNRVASQEKRMYDVLMGREKSQQALAEQDQKFQQDMYLGMNKPVWERQAEFNDLAGRYGPEIAKRMLAAKYEKDMLGNEQARLNIAKDQALLPFQVREAALKNGISEANLRKIEAEIAYLPQDKQLEYAKFLLDQAYKQAQIAGGNADRALKAQESNQTAWGKQQSAYNTKEAEMRKAFEMSKAWAKALQAPKDPDGNDWTEQSKKEALDQATQYRNKGIDLSVELQKMQRVPPPQVSAGAVQMGNVNVPLGTPYAWGGQNLSKGVDCSGLVCEVFKRGMGVDIGDMTAASMHGSKRFQSVKQEELQPYDLIFFYTDGANPRKVSHVGIYMGGGQMLHASSRAGTKIVDLETYPYRNRIAGYRRLK